MNRHPFRWSGLAFGALFLAIAGNWAVWRAELLTRSEMGYIISALLIVSGVIGVLVTLRNPNPPAPVTTPDATTPDSEETP